MTKMEISSEVQANIMIHIDQLLQVHRRNNMIVHGIAVAIKKSLNNAQLNLPFSVARINRETIYVHNITHRES